MRQSGGGARLTGIPSLIAFARVTRIQKAEMDPIARMNMAVSTYSLLRAKYKDKKEVAGVIQEIGEDIKSCRDTFVKFMADNIISPDEDALMSQILDGIEYRIDEVIVLTKAIDTAALEEMMVPE
jgi:hypothetical protein